MKKHQCHITVADPDTGEVWLDIDQTITFFWSNPVVCSATLESTGLGAGTPSQVHCSVPGGRPWYEPNPGQRPAVNVSGAPSIGTMAEFKAFVIERWATKDVVSNA